MPSYPLEAGGGSPRRAARGTLCVCMATLSRPSWRMRWPTPPWRELRTGSEPHTHPLKIQKHLQRFLQLRYLKTGKGLACSLDALGRGSPARRQEEEVSRGGAPARALVGVIHSIP